MPRAAKHSRGITLATRSGYSGSPAPFPPPVPKEMRLSEHEWGMLSFLFSEVAFFSTLIVAYINFEGEDTIGPTPEILSLPLVFGTTACLLSSSLTVHLATHSLERGKQALFRLFWALTIALGIAFLAGTAYEWYGLIVDEHLTISRNLFGTTFYTLVGFHAFHVTVGVIAMSVLLALALGRQVTREHSLAAKLVSWYWHFVDGVWIVVFAVVYL